MSVAQDQKPSVPVQWDSMHFLNGEPGEFVTSVRNLGDDWFLGALPIGFRANSMCLSRFLGKGRYTAEIYEDGGDARLILSMSPSDGRSSAEKSN
jgi:hypothetical protein